MCGIVGYIGDKKCAPILFEGLSRLEYRGYDSAGMAFLHESEVTIVRRKGALVNLREALDGVVCDGKIGIGHTRWATHGRPSEANSHPHTDCSGKLALVHNGIIENYLELREKLIAEGHAFTSETDTEAIVHLIEKYYYFGESADSASSSNEDNLENRLVRAVRRAMVDIHGSFALALICQDEPDLLIAVRKDSPLVVGIGENEHFVASDIPAILKYTKRVLLLDNNEIAIIRKDSVEIETLDGQLVTKSITEVTWDEEAAEKGGFDDFMLKEIFEQPKALRETIRCRLKDSTVIFDEFKMTEDEIRDLKKVVIIACGTSYHAGMVAKYIITKWARLTVEVEFSSEFRYADPVITDNTLMIAISQSGETADTLAGMKEAQRQGAKVIAISNVVGSTITREADGVLHTHAGPEIGVAATKTFITQLAVLYLLGLYLAQVRGSLSDQKIRHLEAELLKVPDQVEKLLEQNELIKESAKKFLDVKDFLYLGRGIGYPVAMEGALKLKEISYIHAEAYAAGEMKHGPIALIDDDLPVMIIANDSSVYEKVISNLQEVKARDAHVMAVATEGNEDIRRFTELVFYIPKIDEDLASITATIPLQFLAYHIAKLKGLNVDMPRNLAKSVTVE